ncbi:MAG: histidine--tRNA ligase [Candidatus Dormibacteria bacterium]|jgi:histidyl-tRNA synthetase
MPEIAAPRGTRDILPDEFGARRWLLDAHQSVAESFGYRPIETPIFEATELFSRGVGTDTDIVEKQMFTFEDRGGRSLTLRPEGTAGSLRAVLGAHLGQEVRPVRVQYAGPFFRAERPQAGRQHQFTQVGIECIGEGSPALDAEIVEVAWRFFRALGISDVHIQINSLGSPEDRTRYRAALVDYYTPLESSLCDDCRRRLHTNPLRLLDCKRDIGLVAAAPVLWDSLEGASRDHFTAVDAILEAAGIETIRNDRLVRGLDYYSHTVFEFWHDTLQGAQSSLGGGGRYDGLAELLGFPATAATGYALGVERILMVARALGTVPATAAAADVLVCSVEPAQAEAAASMARLLRDARTRTVLDVAERRLDRKLRGAERVGARVAVIIGENEVAGASAVVRDLDGRSQQTVPVTELADAVLRILGGQS